jgi:hypothetical protein
VLVEAVAAAKAVVVVAAIEVRVEEAVVMVVVVVAFIAVVVVEDVLGVQGFKPVEEGEDEGEDRVVASVVCALEEFAVLVEAMATVLSAFVKISVLVPLLVCREEEAVAAVALVVVVVVIVAVMVDVKGG